MKSLFYLCLSIVGLWSFSSCTANLEQVETTDLDRESVFADSAYTAGFLSQIYVDVTTLVLTDIKLRLLGL